MARGDQHAGPTSGSLGLGAIAARRGRAHGQRLVRKHPPFTVTSTFKFTNLNADLLDGLDCIAFAPTSHTHSATHITSDTLADAGLSANVALLAGAQAFFGAKTFSNASNSCAGTITGTLTGSGSGFTALGPANKLLYHSFVESPDTMNIDNGNTTTDDRGDATVELPEWFDALNRDFRYQLTVLDDYDEDDAFLWAKVVWANVVRRIGTDARNRFTIRTSRPGLEVSWQVTGVRKDALAEQNRIPVEVDKPAGERGRCLHPEAFGLPSARAIGAGTEPVSNAGPSPATGG
ncbi:MAG: hypothetical protein HRU70_01400 [Phycisphaeraceae bacterium]|nr:MAG: hypothetical protein HRU70_01400 [Phycisphaeraceae bacterium]